MLAGILIATSATIALFLGLAHIYLTFFTRAFAARDAGLEEKLKSVGAEIRRMGELFPKKAAARSASALQFRGCGEGRRLFC